MCIQFSATKANGETHGGKGGGGSLFSLAFFPRSGSGSSPEQACLALYDPNMRSFELSYSFCSFV